MALNLTLRQSALISDTPAQNGGRPTNTVITSGVKNNVWPDLSQKNRTDGIERKRKNFFHATGDIPLVDPKLSIFSATPGMSYELIYPGTMTDTEDELTARPYGHGVLSVDADADDTIITVAVDHADYATMDPNPFQVGDLVRIDARQALAGTEHYEYRTIADVDYVGGVMTLEIDALENDYLAADNVNISSVIEPDDMNTGYSDVGVTGGVTFDDTTYPIVVPATGSIYQVWTITVTDAGTGTFSAAGDTVGSIGTGATGVNFSPSAPGGGTYFTIPADGWGGAPVNGDTLTFTTQPAVSPFWRHLITPALTDSGADSSTILVDGEYTES